MKTIKLLFILLFSSITMANAQVKISDLLTLTETNIDSLLIPAVQGPSSPPGMRSTRKMPGYMLKSMIQAFAGADSFRITEADTFQARINGEWVSQFKMPVDTVEFDGEYFIVDGSSVSLKDQWIKSAIMQNDSTMEMQIGDSTFQLVIKGGVSEVSADTVPDLTAVLAKGSDLRNNAIIEGDPGRVFELKIWHPDAEQFSRLRLTGSTINGISVAPDGSSAALGLNSSAATLTSTPASGAANEMTVASTGVRASALSADSTLYSRLEVFSDGIEMEGVKSAPYDSLVDAGAKALMLHDYEIYEADPPPVPQFKYYDTTQFKVVNDTLKPRKKEYIAYLYQNGTDAPVATVIKNTLGAVSYNYSSEGNFTATSSGLFTPGKTVVSMTNAAIYNPSEDDLTFVGAYPPNDSVIAIWTTLGTVAANNILGNLSSYANILHITVYE